MYVIILLVFGNVAVATVERDVLLDNNSLKMIKQPVKICVANSDWAPFTILSRSHYSKIEGKTPDMVRSLFQRLGLSQLMLTAPWQQCVMLVKSGKADMLLDMSWSQQRASQFLFSPPLYELHYGYFYEEDRYPRRVPIERVDDIANVRVGGIQGYNYDIYPLTASLVDASSPGFRSLLTKLRRADYDVILGYVEVSQGTGGLEPMDLSGLKFRQLPEAQPLTIHLAITRQGQGVRLHQLISDEIHRMRKDGSLSQFF